MEVDVPAPLPAQAQPRAVLSSKLANDRPERPIARFGERRPLGPGEPAPTVFPGSQFFAKNPLTEPKSSVTGGAGMLHQFSKWSEVPMPDQLNAASFCL